jgi:hypothetical protein
MQIDNAGRALESLSQREDPPVRFDRDLLAERNQKRTIARRPDGYNVVSLAEGFRSSRTLVRSSSAVNGFASSTWPFSTTYF